MGFSESFILKALVIPIVGVGTIVLMLADGVDPQAGVAIISSLCAYAIGESNGKRLSKAEVAAKSKE